MTVKVSAGCKLPDDIQPKTGLVTCGINQLASVEKDKDVGAKTAFMHTCEDKLPSGLNLAQRKGDSGYTP